MTAALKTVLVNALRAASDAHPAFDRGHVERYTDDWTIWSQSDDDQEGSVDTICVDACLDADRLATAVRDHFFGDRAKVRAAILAGLQQSRHPDLDAAMAAGFNATGFDPEAHIFDDDLFIDAVIAGLAGGSE